jgi:hypothetical protein
MPIYEYECPVHGVFEVVQSIRDAAFKKCPLRVSNGSVEYACLYPVKRLISGGTGIIMDADKLWEPDPTSHKPRAERRGDLKKHEADLIGVPPQDRDRFRGYKRGKGDPTKM